MGVPSVIGRVMLVLATCAPVSGRARPAGFDAGEPHASCASEIRDLCAERAPDDVLDCLMEHRQAVSERCAGGIAVRTVRAWAWRRSCQSDVQRFCAGVSPREEELLACLGARRTDLSADCASRLDLMAEWSARMRRGAVRFKRGTGSASP